LQKTVVAGDWKIGFIFLVTSLLLHFATRVALAESVIIFAGQDE